MLQPTPSVSRSDVERIVRRDFPAESFSAVLGILDDYGTDDYHREKERVRVAVLKLARGSVENLRREIEGAKDDFRDMLAAAEYPDYSRKMFSVGGLPTEEQTKLIDADWKQYTDWFNR